MTSSFDVVSEVMSHTCSFTAGARVLDFTRFDAPSVVAVHKARPG